MKNKFDRKKKIMILCIVLAEILVIVGCVFLFINKGARNLKKKQAEKAKLASEQELTAEEAEEGIVYYNGKKYRYNEDILTFLIMGVDDDQSMDGEVEMGEAGQADTIFLAMLNTKEKSVELLGISRDTMTDIQILDEQGNYIRTAEEHLAIQYAYGDGSHYSCELMKEAVSDLMYGLPIHGYCAINLNGIPVLNDAVGGVEVTVLEDLTNIMNITEGDYTLKKGATVKLTGEQAHDYVRARNKSQFASNDLRIKRQKQYLAAFADTLIEQTKKDITVPVKILQKMTNYMVTVVSMDEITYLATQILEYDFNLDDIKSIEGEVVQPEGEKYEQFHVDYDALYELILELYYEEVPEVSE